jgi:hypothetical protein
MFQDHEGQFGVDRGLNELRQADYGLDELDHNPVPDAVGDNYVTTRLRCMLPVTGAAVLLLLPTAAFANNQLVSVNEDEARILDNAGTADGPVDFDRTTSLASEGDSVVVTPDGFAAVRATDGTAIHTLQLDPLVQLGDKPDYTSIGELRPQTGSNLVWVPSTDGGGVLNLAQPSDSNFDETPIDGGPFPDIADAFNSNGERIVVATTGSYSNPDGLSVYKESAPGEDDYQEVFSITFEDLLAAIPGLSDVGLLLAPDNILISDGELIVSIAGWGTGVLVRVPFDLDTPDALDFSQAEIIVDDSGENGGSGFGETLETSNYYVCIEGDGTMWLIDKNDTNDRLIIDTDGSDTAGAVILDPYAEEIWFRAGPNAIQIYDLSASNLNDVPIEPSRTLEFSENVGRFALHHQRDLDTFEGNPEVLDADNLVPNTNMHMLPSAAASNVEIENDGPNIKVLVELGDLVEAFENDNEFSVEFASLVASGGPESHNINITLVDSSSSETIVLGASALALQGCAGKLTILPDAENDRVLVHGQMLEDGVDGPGATAEGTLSGVGDGDNGLGESVDISEDGAVNEGTVILAEEVEDLPDTTGDDDDSVDDDDDAADDDDTSADDDDDVVSDDDDDDGGGGGTCELAAGESGSSTLFGSLALLLAFAGRRRKKE